MMRARILGIFVFAALTSGAAQQARADERGNACADAAERGQELRAAHKLVEARPQFVVCAQRECPSVVRESCTEWLADLDRRTPTVVLSAKDEEQHDIAGVSVAIDGVAVPESALSSAVPANPGPRVIRHAAAGYVPHEESVVLREGETMRVLSVTLHRPGAVAERPHLLEPPARPFPIVPVVLGGVSVIALSIFAYSGLTGASDYRRLEKDCGPRCSSNDIDGVRTQLLIADIALVVGVVTGGAALTLWLFNRPTRPSTSAQR